MAVSFYGLNINSIGQRNGLFSREKSGNRLEIGLSRKRSGENLCFFVKSQGKFCQKYL